MSVDSVSTMCRSIPIVQRLVEGKENKSNNISTSEMCVHNDDLVSYANSL